MKKKKKRKNVDETLKIIEKILDYNKNAQIRQKLDIIKKKKENINNELFSYYFDYLFKPSHYVRKIKRYK